MGAPLRNQHREAVRKPRARRLGFLAPIHGLALKLRPAASGPTVAGVTVEPRRLSGQLRNAQSPGLRRRRRIAALALFSAANLGVASLFQLGVIRDLPDFGLPGFHADAVDASAEAYGLLGMPDAPLGVASYAVTLMLASAGGRDRGREQRWLPIALAAKTLVDALYSSALARDQFVKHRALCLWCLGTTAASVWALPLALKNAGEELAGKR
jgi:uncharacterized membrane protein